MPPPEYSSERPLPAETLASISGRDLLIQHIGYWPTFEDFEVVAIALERAPWLTTATRDLRTTFYVFDINRSDEDPERRQGFAEFLFQDVDEVLIDGFNHQNPIIGLSITAVGSEGRRRYRVKWGGTCLPHEVSFTCEGISVLRVVDLNPFRKPLPECQPPAG